VLQPTELRQPSVIPDSPARPGKYIKNNPKSLLVYYFMVGGAVTSWLESSILNRAVQVRALAGDIVLCSWARHYSHSDSQHPGI